jgi:hypothetical protein
LSLLILGEYFQNFGFFNSAYVDLQEWTKFTRCGLLICICNHDKARRRGVCLHKKGWTKQKRQEAGSGKGLTDGSEYQHS